MSKETRVIFSDAKIEDVALYFAKGYDLKGAKIDKVECFIDQHKGVMVFKIHVFDVPSVAAVAAEERRVDQALYR